MQFTLDGLAVFLISAILAGIIIPKILLIAFRKRLFDEPDERKIHTAAVPRLGGIAFIDYFFSLLCNWHRSTSRFRRYTYAFWPLP